MIKQYDVVVAGAGPAGCACALRLKGNGLKVAMVEKASFPRDKICGDALSADVINQLRDFYPAIYNEFKTIKAKKSSYGVQFTSPNGKVLKIPFNKSHKGMAPGYISARMVFDDFLLKSALAECKDMEYFDNQEVKEIEDKGVYIETTTPDHVLHSKLIVAADGARSIVARELGAYTFSKHESCAAIRAYFENINGFDENGNIELYFFKDVIPGYFWIFPMPDNKANVGLGILSSEVSAKKLNLKKIAQDIINNNAVINNRFNDAKQLTPWKGHMIPLGTKKKHISGDRFLLTGDAAGLTDPLTGEGIGNALRSGRYAADHIMKCFHENRFDERFNLQYDRYVYKKIWRELKISYSLQRMLKFPFLFDFVVNKANSNASVKKIISSMLDNVDMKKELTKPSFYFKLIFR